MRKNGDVGAAEASFVAVIGRDVEVEREREDALAAVVETATSAAHRPSGRRARRTGTG
jgi:hypothetical protein